MLEAKEDCDSLKDRFPVADQGYCRSLPQQTVVRSEGRFTSMRERVAQYPRQTSGFVGH